MKKIQKALVFGATLGAGVALGVAAQRFISKELFRFAMERELPRKNAKQRARGKASAQKKAQGELRDAAAERLAAQECEIVEIESYDATRLVGHLRRCEDPKRIILAMHGWRSSWTHDFGGMADFWYDNGCTVLFAEQRAQNASGGDYMGFGILERYDCLEWIRWINENLGTDIPVYLTGISMGASTVLMATGLSLPENVKGVIADCGFTYPAAIWKTVLEKMIHMPYEWFSGRVDKAYKRSVGGESTYSCEDALATCKIPVLFIHGTADTFVPIEMTYANYLACASKKKLLVVPGAEHGLSYYADRQAYEEATLELWRECEGN